MRKLADKVAVITGGTSGETDQRFGGIDVLFANAGVVQAQSLEQVTEQTYDEQMNVNAPRTGGQNSGRKAPPA
jgi:NAD(P)-dependent dehydrogenase (short-subunit alcohol dehydrogenase family)